MTTLQIIILCVLFILDFYLSVILPLLKSKYINYDIAIHVLENIVRLTVVWALLINITISFNELKKQKKCPEYEKIENAYKLKT